MKKDKSQKDNSAQKVAVLIDGDNASSAKLGEVTEVASRYGQVLSDVFTGIGAKPGSPAGKNRRGNIHTV
ncbi:hypothetical protein SAMN05444362_1272 [Dysgonomonas macrotermitis]|uniref:NYN domain-containing protein n=1 Tax=Dysgonomonas macrotermitis TaxID=1346286 RepID=A0A1M5JPH4_9BACT|nr:hypothetical protein SAMN05444362_1272 [Dysgonomonas macrotermitis]